MKDMMKDSVMKDDAELPKNIVGMLRLDYFDDAVGQIEGFQIFGDLMQHGNRLHWPFLMIWHRMLIHVSQSSCGKRLWCPKSPRF